MAWDDPGCVSVHELQQNPDVYPWWPTGAIFCGTHDLTAYYRQDPQWVPPPPPPPPEPPPPPPPPPPDDCVPLSDIRMDPGQYLWYPNGAIFCGVWNGEAWYRWDGVWQPPPPPPGDDLDPWAGELGDNPGDQLNDDWDDDYDQETGEGRVFDAFQGHPAPGTIIGTPGCGTHSPPAGCFLHSISVAHGCAAGDAPCNWQSCNAVDVWLFPGTALTATGPGVVSTRYGWGLMDGGGGRFAGYRLHVELDSGPICFYTHARELRLRPGHRVSRGSVLGWSGIANGVPHLHFGVSIPFVPGNYVRRAYDLTGHRRRRPPHFEPGPPPDFDPGALERAKDAWVDVQHAYGRDRHADNVALRALADRIMGEVR